VLGRFNLYDFEDGTAELGYRVAQHVAGRSVATATVRELCQLATARHGPRTLRAAAARENAASRKVLTKAWFVRLARPISAVGRAPGISVTWRPGSLDRVHGGGGGVGASGRGSPFQDTWLRLF